MVKMVGEALTKIVTFMAPGSGVLVLGQGFRTRITNKRISLKKNLVDSWTANTLLMKRNASTKIVYAIIKCWSPGHQTTNTWYRVAIREFPPKSHRIYGTYIEVLATRVGLRIVKMGYYFFQQSSFRLLELKQPN